MIIVKIYGGMANQLFQYAAGYALSLHHAVPLKLDIRYFEEKNQDTKREFALDKFNIDFEIASESEIDAVFKFRFIDYAWNKLLPIGKKRFYGEKNPGFNESFFELGDHVYLRGYFQSEQFFIDCKLSILEQFEMKNDHLLPIVNELASSESVAIHVRLGDYLNPILSGIMEPFHLEYYKLAIQQIKSKYSNPKCYVFSDQIHLAKELLKLDTDLIFFDSNISKNAMDDFLLMQSCKHQIITNSTFSWWAAYLNNNPHKTVIAPQKWYKAHFGDAIHLFPENWIVL